MLAIIGESNVPVGSRKILDGLRRINVNVSESTVSRILRHLDAQGLTRSAEAKGRVITPEGQNRLAQLHAADNHGVGLARAPDIDNVQDLLDLLMARRGIEREAIRAAALRATPDEIALLEKLTQRHEQQVRSRQLPSKDSLDFHHIIGKASRNSLLLAMIEIAFNPLLDKTEAVLDVIVGSHHSEMRSVAEHQAILTALKARDPDAAEEAMLAHVNRLIQEVEEFAASDWAAVFDRMLAWVKLETSHTASQGA